MEDLFLIIHLITFIVFIFNLIKRKWKRAFTFLGLSIICFVGFGISHDKNNEFVEEDVEVMTDEDIVEIEESEPEVEELEEQYVDPNRVTDQEYAHYTRESQRVITDLLLSPSTAEFPGMFWNADQWEVYKYEGYLYVESWVDSQNAFGAVIRNNFQIKMNLATNDIERIILGDEVYE